MPAHHRDPKVVFLPSGRRGRVAARTRLDEAARVLGADLQSLCGGQGQCGKCKVRILAQGKTDRTPVSAPTDSEIKLLTAEAVASGWRLACQTRILADVTVEIPPESRAGHQLIRKAAGDQTVALAPVVQRRDLQVPPPDLKRAVADWERLCGQLEHESHAGEIMPDPTLVRGLPAMLRQSGGEVTAAIREGREAIAVLGPTPPTLAGVALDVGTTTLAVYLCDLESGAVLATASEVNPQVTYGEDVISRIAHAEGSADGLPELQRAVIGAVNRLIAGLSRRTGVSPDAMVDMVCVGNTCMHHLFCGIDPSGLGHSPFVPAIWRPLDIKARELGVGIAAGASVHLLPVIAGFVGADTVGVLLAMGPRLGDEPVLIVDIGTNGEIVLGNRRRLICSSCAAGPALEGATLRHGMRAASGAVERVWIDPETLAVEYRVIADSGQKAVPAAGICGSGIIDAVAQMFRAGIIKPNGRLNREIPSPRLKRHQEHDAFVIVPAAQSATGEDIVIDQRDIEAVQMAKGAIHAGIRVLMAETGTRSVAHIYLAGAFGSVIDPVSALTIGIFPDFPPARVQAVGNAAGDGARLALLNREKRREAAELARRLEYVELTVHPRFKKEFAMAMYFPHMRGSTLMPDAANPR